MRIGYRTLAVWGPQRLKAWVKSAVAHKWADWLHNPCHLGGPQRFGAGDKVCSGPQVGGLATQPQPCGGSSTLRNTRQNKQWPTSGWIGYIAPAVLGVPNASERATKPAVAHKCADWLHNSCHVGGPKRFRAGDKVCNGPQVCRLAT